MSPREAKVKKDEVLAMIVEAYFETGAPVSSMALVERGMKCSSATIRNIMAEFIDEGFLAQPHTSAGRIPTAKAYRYYLDFLMERAHEDLESDLPNFASRTASLDGLIKHIADSVSELMHQTGMSAFWGHRDVYLHGRNYLIDYSELQDIDKLREIFTFLEDEQSVHEILWRDIKDRVNVFVGNEIGRPEVSECSLIISACDVGDGKEIRIGIIGPMRMDYGRNLSLLERLSEEVEGICKRIAL